MTSSPEHQPSAPSLFGPRLKLSRANEQLDELEPKLRAFSNSTPFRISEPENDGDWLVLRYVDVTETPDPAWGVRIGEILHDVRSALDNLVWQLVLANGREPGDYNQFPIYTHPNRLGRPRVKSIIKKLPKSATRIDEMLFGVHRDQVAVIKELQPYLGPHMHRNAKIALSSVAHLNNVDKHKVVHPSVAWAQRDGREVRPSHTAGPPPDQLEVRHQLGMICDGAEAFRWRIVGGGRETEVTMEGEIPFDVTFGHHPNLTLGHYHWLCDQIGEVIERFAQVFPVGSDGD